MTRNRGATQADGIEEKVDDTSKVENPSEAPHIIVIHGVKMRSQHTWSRRLYWYHIISVIQRTH